MNHIGFDIFLRIFDYVALEVDLFRWSKSCKSIRLFFREELVCKQIIDRFYGLDRGALILHNDCYDNLLYIGSRTSSYFHACQYGFFKKINKFNALTPTAQMYCMEVATANYQYHTIKYCIKHHNFTPNWYHEYHKNNNMLLIAISTKSNSILNLFYNYKFFPNDDLWLYTPDDMFTRVYKDLGELNHIRFLENIDFKHRWEQLLLKVNHRKVFLNDECYKNLTTEAIKMYLKSLPNSTEIIERTLRVISNRNVFDEWTNLLSFLLPTLSADRTTNLFEALFFGGSKRELIHIINLPEFVVSVDFLKRIYQFPHECLKKFDDPDLHTPLVKKYQPNTSKYGWNIMNYLTQRSQRNRLFCFFKYWVKHYQCLMNYLSTNESHFLNEELLKEIAPVFLENLKTSDDYLTFMKYLCMFKESNTAPWEFCKSAFDKFATTTNHYDLLCTIFNIAAIKGQFAINLFPNIERLSNEQFLMNITTKNYKTRIDALINVKKIPLKELALHCSKHLAKLFAILYIFDVAGEQMANDKTNNNIIQHWLSDKKCLNLRFLKQQDKFLIEQFFKCAKLLL